MNRSQVVFLLCFIFVILIGDLGNAACTGSRPTWTSTPDSESVASCVSNAATGDTIIVTAGSGTVTWPANAITVPASKSLKIIGPGIADLTITLGGNNAVVVNAFDGTLETPGTRISGFKFVSPLDTKRTAISVSGHFWRVDHCYYESIESDVLTPTPTWVNAHSFNTPLEPIGLIDNNIVVNGKIYVSNGNNTAETSAIWAVAPNLGSANVVIVEDNVISSSLSTRKEVMDEQWAGRYTFRYNTLTNVWTLAHGVQGEGMRGAKQWEFYGNTYNIGFNTGLGIAVLAGTGVVFNNNMLGTYAGLISLGHNRSAMSYTNSGLCDGTSLWDGNAPGQNGWPCRDQIGTGFDAYAWTDQTVLPAPAQTMLPAYIWGNWDKNGVLNPHVDTANHADRHIKKDRDFAQGDATNCAAGAAACSAGVGCGTLTNRPGNCTPGVAYWATTQSCNDISGMVGARATTPISGTLYKCNASGNWETYYTPYTYPHPLTRPEQPKNLKLLNN